MVILKWQHCELILAPFQFKRINYKTIEITKISRTLISNAIKVLKCRILSSSKAAVNFTGGSVVEMCALLSGLEYGRGRRSDGDKGLYKPVSLLLFQHSVM